MTAFARYSLITMRPDPERMDVLCVGALVLLPDGSWQVLVPGKEKLEALGYLAAARRLMAISVNLRELLADCSSIQDARTMLAGMRSSLGVHEFEGFFSYDSEAEFARHVNAITLESIAMPQQQRDVQPERQRVHRTRVRTRLRRHFEEMGVLAPPGDKNADHKVVPDYPINEKHGLKAEFAVKNTVWHITETVDFDVASEGIRNKTFEAQAKCLVMHAAQEAFGPMTKRYIVVRGGESEHAHTSVDLLSTVGRLFMAESNEDMTTYFDLIAKAAHGSGALGAPN